MNETELQKNDNLAVLVGLEAHSLPSEDNATDATLEELAAVVPKNTAQAVYVHFHPAENQQRKDGAP